MGLVTLEFRTAYDAMGLSSEELQAAGQAAFADSAEPLDDIYGVEVLAAGTDTTGATGIRLASGTLRVLLRADAADAGEHPDLVQKHYVEPSLELLGRTVGGYPLNLVFGRPRFARKSPVLVSLPR